MTDRELLYNAAKAAGIKYVSAVYNGKGEFVDENLLGLMLESGGNFWNPLEDDGDALRLSVSKTIIIGYVNKPRAYMAGHVFAVSSAGIFYEHGFSRESVRRAIVCAAAEVGKLMP